MVDCVSANSLTSKPPITVVAIACVLFYVITFKLLCFLLSHTQYYLKTLKIF